MLGAIGVLVGAGASACGEVGALHLTVTTAADGGDANVGDRVCEMTVGAGDCSLRAAIDETNVAPLTFDVITIADGIDPVLTRPGGEEDANATGDLDITGWVTIHGGGATIDAAGLDRVLDHHGPALAIDHVTITGGVLSGDGETDDEWWDNDPAFAPGNGAFGDGGGIRSTGVLTVADSTITGNQLLYLIPANGPFGAGIDVSGGPVLVTGTNIEANRSLDGTAGWGGGLAAHDIDDLRIATSTVRGNLIGGNWHSYEAGGGGISLERADVAIERSTVSDNVAGAADGRGEGAGIRTIDSNLDIVRSTLSDNTAGTDYGPVNELYARGGSVDITGSTIANRFPELSVAAATEVTIRSSVVVAICSGTVVSAGFNVAGPVGANPNPCPLGAPTDRTGVDPLIGPLADHGGPTETRLPDPGSPVIDAIPLGAAGACDAPTTDQRGGTGPRRRGVRHRSRGGPTQRSSRLTAPCPTPAPDHDDRTPRSATAWSAASPSITMRLG